MSVWTAEYKWNKFAFYNMYYSPDVIDQDSLSLDSYLLHMYYQNIIYTSFKNFLHTEMNDYGSSIVEN